jgi:hypothetical protein
MAQKRGSRREREASPGSKMAGTVTRFGRADEANFTGNLVRTVLMLIDFLRLCFLYIYIISIRPPIWCGWACDAGSSLVVRLRRWIINVLKTHVCTSYMWVVGLRSSKFDQLLVFLQFSSKTVGIDLHRNEKLGIHTLGEFTAS